jgi:hypothetical protein
MQSNEGTWETVMQGEELAGRVQARFQNSVTDGAIA